MPSLDLVLASGPAAGERPLDEAAAFAEAVEGQTHRLARLIQRLLGWRPDAEVDDVLQDVLLAAWTHRATFRGECAFGTWLARIAVRRARNANRSRARRARLCGLLGFGPGAEPASPDEGAARALIRAGLAELRPADREILVLRYLERWPIDELARALRLTRAAADGRLSRARRRLRTRLEEARP